ncbi:reverse transcriptase domain-containing protein [Tanacetum coccineum]
MLQQLLKLRFEDLRVAFGPYRDAFSVIFGLSITRASDEELEEPIKDQPLPADASPTALSPGYIVDSDPKEDEEDPADHPADEGDNDDNESSGDDDDDDDMILSPQAENIEACETDESASTPPTSPHHFATALPSSSLPPSVSPPPENIKFVARDLANAIKAIAIYETKTNIAHKSVIQTKRQEDKVAENASNKRKWEGNHNGSSSQQNKGHKVPRAHITWPINKKAYAGSLPLCNQCKFHHNGPCTVKCGNCKKFGHITRNCRTPTAARNQRTLTCYKCGSWDTTRVIVQ